MDDFDSAKSKGVKEIEDLNYEVNLDEIIKKTKLLLNIDLLKGYSPYRKYLNLNELAYEKADFGFLKSLFGKENFLEEYIYISIISGIIYVVVFRESTHGSCHEF